MAVVDVTDPTHPKHVETLHGPGRDATIETLHAVDAPERAILVDRPLRRRRSHRRRPDTAPVDVWDVHDCRSPKLLSTIDFPANVHNLTLTADGKTTVVNTLPLEAVDLTDPRHPKVPRRASRTSSRRSGALTLQYAHEAWPSPDDNRLYIGGQEAVDEELLVVDIEGWPARPARVVGERRQPGHSIRPATINGRPYLLNSDESVVNPTAKGCVPNAAHPVRRRVPAVPHRHLATSDCTHGDRPDPAADQRAGALRQQSLSGVNASVHYHDVDDPDDTTFVMASMWNAGLRIFDVRDPAPPQRGGLLQPRPLPEPTPPSGRASTRLIALQRLTGSTRRGRIPLRARDRQIWLATTYRRLLGLELEPQVRAALGLPAMPTHSPSGGPPRPVPTRVPVAASLNANFYCTINLAKAALGIVA